MKGHGIGWLVYRRRNNWRISKNNRNNRKYHKRFLENEQENIEVKKIKCRK